MPSIFVWLFGIFVVLYFLSVPLYVFEDLLKFSEWATYAGTATVYLAVTLLIHSEPRFNVLAALFLYRKTGLEVRQPITIIGILLSLLFYAAAYFEYHEDDSEGNNQSPR